MTELAEKLLKKILWESYSDIDDSGRLIVDGHIEITPEERDWCEATWSEPDTE